MTGKEFMRAMAHGEVDMLQTLLDILAETGAAYCVVGGLAVNAYAEPVVSLDLDIVVAADAMEKVLSAAESRGIKVDHFEHSIYLTITGSDVRIQLQGDDRYQAFIPRSEEKEILGYRMQVASAADVLEGKIWAYQDEQRRGSKRQKDLADIMRLVEEDPALLNVLPPEIRKQLEVRG